MQPLKNERHERFAQLIALGTSHVAAYQGAGYTKRKAASACAARLLRNASVSARINHLTLRAAERVEITLDSLVADAARCRDLGIWHGQINAAVLAVKELGILTGFRVERRETRTIDPATISDEELAAIIRAGPPVEVTAHDVTAIKSDARARLEAPSVSPKPSDSSEAQPADRDGRNVGRNGLEERENATISKANAANAETTRGTAPKKRDQNAPILPSDIPIDRPVAPGTIEKAIRGLRRGRATSAPRPDLDDKSTT